MGDSTVNFGLDVTTGESVSSVDKLTNSVSSLLERYTELMTKMGRGDEVFGKVFKAMGSNAKDFKAAAEEIARAQKMLAGDTGTNKASKNMSSQFKSLATELKTSLAGIPNEIKSATTQMLGMTTILQNQLGSIGVNLVELKERLTQAGTAAEAAKKKIAGSKGTTDTDITERQKQQAAFYDAGIARELEARKAQKQTQVELAARAKAQYKEQQAEEAKKAQMVTSYFAQNTAMLTKQRAEIAKLNAEQEKATNKKNKETDADLQRIITNQYREQQQEEKRLAQVAKTEAAAKIALLKEEEVKRKAVIAAMREQAVADRLGTKDSSAGTLKSKTQGLLRNIEAVQQATVNYGTTSRNTIFQTISTFKVYIDEVKTLDDAYKNLAKETKDPSVLKYIEAQRAGLKSLKEEAVLAGKGLSFGGTDKLKNAEAIRTQEEIELLKKYAELTDKVRLAKEKLNSTKGSKSDTSQARNEMEALRKEQEALSKEMLTTSKMFAAVGMSGSKAMDDIRASSSKLGNEMASFKGTISATESSFKNMWGSMTMGLGKFMLYYHTISVGFSALSSSFTAIKATLDGVMRQGEILSNAKKVFSSIEGGDVNKSQEHWQRLTQQAEYYGTAVQDLIGPYQKWAMVLKETRANTEEGWKLFEHMIAAAKPLGITDAQQMSEYFAGLTQLISKGKANMEDFRQQLAEKIPGLYQSTKKAIADAMKVDMTKFDFEGMVKKGQIPLNRFLSAIDSSLIKFAKLGETISDSYTSAVNRMRTAWAIFMEELATGPVGLKVTEIIEDVTTALKDRNFQEAIKQVVTQFANLASLLTKMATTLLPELGNQLRKFAGDSKIAQTQPQLYSAAKAAYNVPKNVSEDYLTNFSTQAKQAQTLTVDVSMDNIVDLMRKGFLYKSQEGTLKAATDAQDAFNHQLQISEDATSEELKAMVLDPLIATMDALKTDYKGLREQLLQLAMDTGAAQGDALSRLISMSNKQAADMQKAAIASGTFFSLTGNLPIGTTQERMAEMTEAAKPKRPMGPLLSGSGSTVGNLGIAESKVGAGGDSDSKLKAFSKGLENIQDQINKASMGKWVYEFAQVNHKLKELEIELGSKAAPQIAELGVALRKEFLENFSRGLEEFDNSLDMSIRAGRYGKELQTSFDAVTKTYRDNLKKIDVEYKGISSVEATKEQLDKVAGLKQKAEEAKKAGYEAAVENAMASEKMIAKLQVQSAEDTARELMAIRDKETKDVVELEKALVNEVDRYSKEGYDRKVANIDRAVAAEIKAGVASVDAFKWGERKKQEELDKSIDIRIASAENFTDYLNTRFSKEQGLFDNPTVAATKQFEKMYDVVGSGAAEMGQTIQQALTDSFTGVLKSWQDVWKQIQATFIKGLAAMIWAAKMRPIQLSIVSALTGVGTAGSAFAGASTAGNTAAQAHDFVTGGSQASVGIFSKLTKNVEEMTKSINAFGKNTLEMTTDLTDALAGGLLGFGIAKVMFPENQMAQLGGTIGGAAGQALGATFGSMGGPIGSAIGSVVGGVIGKFFQQGKKVTDYGIRVSVDEQGLKFLDKYERIKKSGGLSFSGLAGLATFATTGQGLPVSWQNGSKRDKYSEVDPEVYRQISSAITTSFSTVSRQMLSLGLAPDFSGFSIDEKVSLKGKDPEALLQAWLNKLSGKMVDTALANDSVLASFAAAKKMGETSSDALTRLVTAMTALEAGAIKANISIETLAGGLSGIDLASYASDFSDALGGSSGVSAFFDRIEKFIGYTGTQGITNINTFEDKFTAALGNINSYSGESGTRASVLAGQKMNLELTKASIESNLEKFASGGGWRQWLKFDGENLTMTGKGGYTTPEQMAAADPKWKATLDPMIAYVKELKTTNQALAAIDTKIERESNLPQAANLSASSATFWGDYQKALSQEGGLTPELAAAWDAAAQVAESLAEMRESAISAREELEKQVATYNEQRQTLELSAQYFRASSTGLKSLSLQAQALNQSDLGQWFKQVGNQIAEDLVPGLMSFNRIGETAFDTLIRLTNIFQSTEQAAALAGTNLATLSGGLTGLGTANYAQGLADYFGGADIVSGIFSNISDAVYTDDESKDVALQYWKKQAESQAKALGTDLENSKAWIKGQLASPLSAEQLQNINVLATSLNNMEDASSSASDAVDDLADYLQDLTDKILTLGMTETEEFIFNLKNEVKDMYDTIIEKGGTENQAQLAYKYQQAAIKQRLDDTMKDINLSIRKLVSNDLIEQINQLSDSYLEQINSAMLLGATQEELNAILYNSYLQAKQVLASAANAYITAYDTSLSKIEELKNKQQALEDDVDTARNDYMTSLKKEIDLKQEAIDKLQENVDSLKDFILNLKDLKTELATSAGFLSPEEKAGVTLSEFSKTANLAAGGDADARSKISDKAKSAIDAATSGSYEQYIATFAAVYGKIADLETSAQTELTPQEKQLQVLTASRDAMQGIYDELQKAADKTLAVDDARTAYENAQIALSNSTYDAQIAAMQAEADRHKIVVEALRLQYDTTLSLTQASQQYYQIKDTVEAMMPTQEAIAADMELIRKSSEKQKEALQLIEEYLYPETTASGDTGIKTIVAATSVRDGVLLALRAANDLTTMDATSVVGLLNGIKTCSCASTPTDGCATYGDVGECDAFNDVLLVADPSEQATLMTDKVFNTVEAAMSYVKTVGTTFYLWQLKEEDADCSGVSNVFMTTNS